MLPLLFYPRIVIENCLFQSSFFGPVCSAVSHYLRHICLSVCLSVCRNKCVMYYPRSLLHVQVLILTRDLLVPEMRDQTDN